MARLSVIVPVYNVENYLDRCLSSLIHQSFHDLEIIVVNDGSTDNSADICEKYVQIDSRIKVVHQKNKGVSVARNVGIDMASGEWLSFIDSDDFLELDTYELLFAAVDKYNCDLAIMDFAFVDENNNIVRERQYGEDEILNQKEVIRKQFDIPLTIRCAMSNKMIRKDVLGELRFDEKLRGSEDTLLLSQCLSNVNSAYWVRKPLYRNVQRMGSAMHGGLGLDNVYSTLAIHKRIADETKMLFPDLYDYAYAYYIDTCVWKMRNNMKGSESVNQQDRKRYLQFSKKMRKKLRSEVCGILKCKQIPAKLKAHYIWISCRG